MMSPELIRKKSIHAVLEMGLIPPNHLPITDESKIEKSPTEVARRVACLNAVVAVCFGCPPLIARTWICNNKLQDALTVAERQFLDCDFPDNSMCREKELLLEAIWALLWALGCVQTLDFSDYCGENLKELTPKVGDKNQSALEFAHKAKLRSLDEIVQAEDLAYCLDWFASAAEKTGESVLPVRAYVIRKRRHALSWLLSKECWDDVPLDT